MPDLARTRAEAARLKEWFIARGAAPVETGVLQPAETLLDLYGEDIRARAFTTHDPLAGELMLRPDFTVPVVQMHMAEGTEPARYAYAGNVFRRQEEETGRPREYIQAGYEVFDRADPAAADAEVFALIAEALGDLPVSPVTGDIGILMAAVQGLGTTRRRKAALMRHIWRPRRFRALLDRFSGRSAVPATRAALLARPDPMAGMLPPVGLRRPDEIAERIAALREDAAERPISGDDLALLERLLAVAGPCPAALSELRALAAGMEALVPAVDRLASRLAALASRGIDVDALAFDAAYGRSSMEYYDGFVFSFYARNRADLPPVATGGRYDALTRQLGDGRSIPAVGGVIRPGLTLEMAGDGK